MTKHCPTCRCDSNAKLSAQEMDEMRREGVKAEGAAYFCVPVCHSCLGQGCPRAAHPSTKAKYLKPEGRK